jgi:hypothetical protein
MATDNVGHTEAPKSSCEVQTLVPDLNSFLPVELLSLQAKPLSETILVEWETAMEISSDHFILQRSLGAGIWADIAFIPAAGNSTGIRKYAFEDENVWPGTRFYYRIRIVDLDGSARISETVEARIDGEPDLIGELYPNPTDGKAWLDLISPASDFLSGIVYDVRGTAAGLISQRVDPGLNRIQLDVHELPAGVYFVKLRLGRQSVTRKLVRY